MGQSSKEKRDDGVPRWALEGLSSESRGCLQRLAAYRAPPSPNFGIVKQAAVLVILFQRPDDHKLSVVLTTRAKTLRSHPSQTALPGGRVDIEDPSPLFTARREAFEEVSLPLSHPHIHHVTAIDPVVTILPLNAHMKNHIVVFPIVCFVSDASLVTDLKPNPDEVDHIFTHPLRGCHDGYVNEDDSEGLADKGGEWWPYVQDFYSADDRTGTTGRYRMHRFRTTRTPIKGLTSDVLINTSTIAYDSPPSFERFADGQPAFSTVISNTVRELPSLLALELSRASSMAGDEERRPLEWGGTEPGVRILSGENWHERA